MQQRGGLGELEETAGGCPTPGAPSSPAAFSRLPVVETLPPLSDCKAQTPRRSRGRPHRHQGGDPAQRQTDGKGLSLAWGAPAKAVGGGRPEIRGLEGWRKPLGRMGFTRCRCRFPGAQRLPALLLRFSPPGLSTGRRP